MEVILYKIEKVLGSLEDVFFEWQKLQLKSFLVYLFFLVVFHVL